MIVEESLPDGHVHLIVGGSLPDGHVHLIVGESLPDGHVHLIVGESLYLKVKVSEGISAPDGEAFVHLTMV